MRRLVGALVLFCCACGGNGESGDRLLVGMTHTIEDSGLLEALLSAYRTTSPAARIHVIVAGSGEILQYGRRRDLDVLLVHAPADELTFMTEGHGIERRPVMWNEFVLLAPPADPAEVAGMEDVVVAFRKVAAAGVRFVSRGDFSGTHQRELELWSAAGTRPAGEVHVEAGTGMADALRIASNQGGYILSDVATWSVLGPELDLHVVSAGDDRLVNALSAIRVADARNPVGAQDFVDWLTGPEAQALIGAFGGGKQLFRPGVRESDPTR